MTREEACRFWPIIKAYAEGKQIEVKDDKGVWLSIKYPDFDSYFGDYRIKEEPKYRPFKNANECWEEMVKHGHLGWITNDTKFYFFIQFINEDSIRLGDLFFKFKQILNIGYTFIDGTPFGIKEED